MINKQIERLTYTAVLIVSQLLLLPGCQLVKHSPKKAHVYRLPPVLNSMPRELEKTVIPDYVIEPPDILTIEAVHAVPKAPYRLRPLDVLTIHVSGTVPEAPISGTLPVDPGGGLNLGNPYGSVKISGMTVEEARDAITQHLKEYVREPRVSVALAQLAAAQQLLGEFLVAPDGKITLGSYGQVPIVGLTVPQAKDMIEAHLSQFLEAPEVSVNVYAYNSKVYYVILQGAGLGDSVTRVAFTGNETVLDAISKVNGLRQVSSKKIWIARPTRNHVCAQVLPVDYVEITEQGIAATNYQVLPGDRLFIAEDKMVALDTRLAKLFTPIERFMGFSLLGAGTATRYSGAVLKGGGNPIRGGGF